MGTVPPDRGSEAGDPIAAAAIADLASTLEIPADQIELMSRDRVTWHSGALGCPEPGMEYPQALVEGIRLLLSHEGTSYEYRQGGSGAPFLCPYPDRAGTVRRPIPTHTVFFRVEPQ